MTAFRLLGQEDICSKLGAQCEMVLEPWALVWHCIYMAIPSLQAEEAYRTVL